MTVIDFADDNGVTIVAPNINDIEILKNEAIWKIKPWLEDAGLAVAENKTEKDLITKRCEEELANTPYIHNQRLNTWKSW